MNKELQTAYDIGREYSARLQEMAAGYESLSGKPVTADNYDFWNSREVEKVETLSAFWWMIARYGDPFYSEEFIEENNTSFHDENEGA